MIFFGVSIDYLPQLERAGHETAAGLLASLRALASDFGAQASARSSPLVLSFPDHKAFDVFLAAEALARLHAAVAEAAPGLRGVTLAVHHGPSLEDTLGFFDAQRLALTQDLPCAFSPEAQTVFKDHFPRNSMANPTDWVEPLHRIALGSADAGKMLTLGSSPDPAFAALPAIVTRDERLVALTGYRPTRSPAAFAQALAALPGAPATLALRSPRNGTKAFYPLTTALAPPEDRPAFQAAAQAPYAGQPGQALARACASSIHEALDALGPALLVCDSPENFSPEAVALIAERLRDGRGRERYLTLDSANPPDALLGPWSVAIRLDAPESMAVAGAIHTALGDCDQLAKDKLERRCAALSGRRNAHREGGGAAAVLSIIPREAAIHLHAIGLADGVLSADQTSGFFRSTGLSDEGVRVLGELLRRAGLTDPAEPLAILQPVDDAIIRVAAGLDGAAACDTQFADYLTALYRERAVRPSLGILQRVGEREREEGLLYDCLFADALAAPPDDYDRLEFLSPSSRAVHGFWAALARRDRPAAELAAAGDAAFAGPRADALRGLARSELAYAQGDAERSAKGAREALLAMGKGAPAKLETRAHRMMGLSALAMERFQEASDYLVNAQELAEAGGDEYERFMAMYGRCVAEFMTGSLVRAGRLAESARESASLMFHVEALSAVDFLTGRIEFELGSYDEAARRLDSLAQSGDTYALPDLARRARVWKARALAYAGSYGDAEDELRSLPDDTEARVFLGELDLLRGRPRDALTWLTQPDSPKARPFRPADAFSWDSGFADIEDSCIEFGGTGAALEELRKVLSWYATGLANADPVQATELYAHLRTEKPSRQNPGTGTYSFLCYLLEEGLAEPPVDKQTVLSRAFKVLQQRSGRIEDRAMRALYMEKNYWNRRLLEAARANKFI